MNPPTRFSDIILIGPIRSGKSTIGRLLAERLEVPQISMDALCWDYYKEIGFNEPNTDQNGPDGRIASHFDLYALERLLADHRVWLVLDTPIDLPITAVRLITEITRFTLDLTPYLALMDEIGLTLSHGSET